MRMVASVRFENLVNSEFIYIVALTKEDGNDPDMVEMIASEIESLSSQLKDLEEKMKV